MELITKLSWLLKAITYTIRVSFSFLLNLYDKSVPVIGLLTKKKSPGKNLGS